MYLSPEAYLYETPGVLQIPGFRMRHLGAASMSEPLGAIVEAIWDIRKAPFTEALQFISNQRHHRVGSASPANELDSEDYLPIFTMLLRSGVPMSLAVLDLGANDGAHPQSPLYSFYEKYGRAVTGFAVEGNPEYCARHRASRPRVQLHCGWLTTQGLHAAVLPLARLNLTCAAGPPRCVDLWKMDIDSIDCTVLEMLLQSSLVQLLPKVIIAEVNTGIPPPYKFSILSVSPTPGSADENTERIRRGLFGCSLSHMVSLLERFGYWLVGFAHKDALFLHGEHAAALGLSAPLDEFVLYANAQLMVDQAAASPRQLRQWAFGQPHLTLGLIQRHLRAAQEEISQDVTYSLGL